MLRLFKEYTKRNMTSLNGDWLFSVDPDNIGEKEEWFKAFPENHLNISVPGSWNTQFVNLFGYKGFGWFCRTFTTEKCYLQLEFEAVSGQTHVWLDGEALGSHYGGWTAFAFEKFVEAGEHILVLRTEPNGNNLNTIPLAHKDWYNYGGIMRSVTATQFTKPFISDTKITYDLDVQERCADVTCEVKIKNPFGSKYSTTVSLSVEENVIAGGDIETVGEDTVVIKARVQDLALWNIGKGNLYNVTVATKDDCKNHRIGFRKIETREREILLNGKSIFMKGVNRHEEHPDWGFAVPPALNHRDVNILKELNCNTVRGSHYPNSHIFLDELDREGILFWSEIPMWGFSAEKLADSITQERAEVMITEMVQQYGNHPSIVIWGMHNEVDTASQEGLAITEKLYNLIRDLDSSRLVTFASNRIEEDICFTFCDIICINQYIGWYDGEISE